uniref:Uncharacterized protein n=1 Tax=Cyanothece sp. (strain PCC 7425 / ATCC 29141) TaxID=395961 RepID=B8HM16_CYAP4
MGLVAVTSPTTPPAGMEDAIPYSIGLVIVCVALLLLLWLPDVLRKD